MANPNPTSATARRPRLRRRLRQATPRSALPTRQHFRAHTPRPANGVLANDTDADSDPLTASLINTTSYGALSFNSDGTFTYTPNAGYVGSDTFTYQDSDGALTSNPATVTINVTAMPPPVANNDTYSVVHDSTLTVPAAGVLANDTDPNSLPLSAVLVYGASNGSVQLNANGSFTYTPKAGFTGTDSFSYYATDGQQNSNTATVTLNVTDTGTITTTADNYSVLHDRVLSVDASTGVLANDSDSDGDLLTAALYGQPAHGSLSLNSDGSFLYTPNAGFTGTDTFQYTTSDGVSSSYPTSVTINVTDQAPTAINHAYGVPENTAESVTATAGLLQGASDADGDPLTASLASNPSHGAASVNSDGSFIYTPNTDYVGTDSFQYAVSDGAESTNATVTLNVHGSDGGPTAGSASYSVRHDDVLAESAAQGLLNYASDADGDPLTVSLVIGSGPQNGTLQLNPDGSFIYTPNAGYVGNDTFQYTASDGAQTSNPATVTISVTDANAPVANPDSYTVERNNVFRADPDTGVLANDTDADNDPLTATLASGPSYGSLTLNTDGSFTYSPNTNYTGTDSFTYTASDGVLTSPPTAVTLNVTSSPPVAANQNYDVLQGTPLNALPGALMVNDSNPDNMTLTAQDVTQPANGTVSVNPDGSFSYVPNTGYVGSDSFTFDLTDGSLTSTPATVSIIVKATNTAPTAQNLSYTLAHDTELTTDSSNGVLSQAADGDGDLLTAALVGGPTHGTLSINLDGTFTYTPNAGYFGTDTFTFKAFDGTSYSNVATATLNVTNDAPTAVNDNYSVLATAPTMIAAENGVLMNDTDGEDDPLSAVQVGGPAHGAFSFNSDGSFSYTPAAGFTGRDSFTYEAYDGVNYSNVATVTLTTGPVASGQSYSVNHDTSLTVNATDGLLTGASDAASDPLTAALATGPSHGTVTVNSDGSFLYTPATHYTGTDSFTFTASDGSQTSAPVTATIDVTNEVPVVSYLGCRL